MGISLRLAWRNIWRHPRRTGLTLAAIVFSDVLLVFMIGLQLGQYDLMIENTLRIFSGHIQIQAEGYIDKPKMHLTISAAAEQAQRIRDQLPVKGVSVRAMGFALVSSRERSYGAQIVGVDPAHEQDVSIIPGLTKKGRYLGGLNKQEAIVGTVMARNLKLKLGDEITLLGSGKDGSFAANVVEVVGIFESGSADLDRYFVQIPLGTFQETFSMGSSAHSIVITGRRMEDVPDLYKKVVDITPQNQNLDVLNWERLQPGVKQAIQADFVSAWFMYAIFIAIVAFSVLNTFLMSVLERTREFGIMLALGLRPLRIGRLIMLESLLLSGTGLLLGTIIGSLVTGYFYVYGFTYPGLEEMVKQYNLPATIQPELSLTSVTLGPGIIFIVTILVALYPALRIRLLRPVDAMQTV